MKNEKRFIFKKDGVTECSVCGIEAFSHIHPAGSNPIDFITMEEKTVARARVEKEILEVILEEGCDKDASVAVRLGAIQALAMARLKYINN